VVVDVQASLGKKLSLGEHPELFPAGTGLHLERSDLRLRCVSERGDLGEISEHPHSLLELLHLHGENHASLLKVCELPGGTDERLELGKFGCGLVPAHLDGAKILERTELGPERPKLTEKGCVILLDSPPLSPSHLLLRRHLMCSVARRVAH
jgi:hypothetical protein